MEKELKTTGQWAEYYDDVFVPNKETKITVCRTHKYTDTETKEFKTLGQWGASKGDVFESVKGTKLTVDRTDEHTATGYTEYMDKSSNGEARIGRKMPAPADMAPDERKAVKLLAIQLIKAKETA